MRWEPPAWGRWTGARAAVGWRYLRSHPGQAVGLLAVLAAAAGGAYWYSTLPKPHYVAYTVEAPGLTEYDDSGVSSVKPLRVVFAEPAAPLKQIERAVTAGIDLSPAVAGRWFWMDDRTLEFAPKGDWPVDGRFRVRMERDVLLAPGVRLEDYRFDVASQPFSAAITQSEFYQDPRDPSLKKLVATIRFSHPVDPARLEPRVSLAVAKDAEYLGLTPDSRHFTVAYDKFKLQAFVHSAALAVPRDDTPMTMTVDTGVRAARGGNDTPERLQAVVTIPGRTSLRFSDASMSVVDNARYEPEQVLLLASSSPVAERALAGTVAVRLLPERHPKQPAADTDPYDWRDPGEIGQAILGASPAVPLTYVPSEEGEGTAHGFKFRAPVGRYLHVTVKEGIQGIGGYLSGKPYVATVQVEPYPKTLTFLGEGALLSLSGDRQVGFLVRDVDHVEVEIARLLPNQLQHVAPLIGSFTRPSVYSGLEDKLVERFTTSRSYTGRAPGKPVYDSIDVGKYLVDRTQTKRGLFLLHVRAKAPDPDGEAATDASGEEGESDGDGDYEGDYEPRPARGHPPDPRDRPRLHRQAGQGRQPRRLRAVDPHRPAGGRGARRGRRCQR